MRNAVENIKAEVRGLKPYALRPHRASIKINQNENPWDAPERIRTETLKRLESQQWSRYPPFVAAQLQQKLADFAHWTSDGVIAGNGSNELIQALLMVTIGPGKRVLICEPTFALYRQITTVLGGEIVAAPLRHDFEFDRTAMLDAIRTHRPDVTIICSPNNPTGCIIAEDDLRQVLEQTTGLVAVDEAYHEFAGHSVVPLLRDHANLIVLRTFSKAMALAGLRVGYLMTAPELAIEIRKAVLPYNLNLISQTAAEVAIDAYENELAPLVAEIVRQRELLFVEVGKIDGLAPVGSRANFMIVRSAIPVQKIFGDLLRHDILVRDVSGYPMLQNYFRLTVGRPEENERLIAALREISAPGVTTAAD